MAVTAQITDDRPQWRSARTGRRRTDGKLARFRWLTIGRPSDLIAQALATSIAHGIRSFGRPPRHALGVIPRVLQRQSSAPRRESLLVLIRREVFPSDQCRFRRYVVLLPMRAVFDIGAQRSLPNIRIARRSLAVPRDEQIRDGRVAILVAVHSRTAWFIRARAPSRPAA